MKIRPALKKEYAEYVATNGDSYGSCVVRFTERWADLMESRMEASKLTVAEVARPTFHEADTEGITGFMYGCAAQSLAHFWTHGEELRRWHNLDTQIGNEGEKANESGGVLNPALLNIG